MGLTITLRETVCFNEPVFDLSFSRSDRLFEYIKVLATIENAVEDNRIRQNMKRDSNAPFKPNPTKPREKDHHAAFPVPGNRQSRGRIFQCA